VIVSNIDIEISSACNLSCLNCAYNKVSSKKQFMSADTFEKIVTHVEENFVDIKNIQLVGLGEQTLHPEFNKIVARLRRDGGFNLSIATNGTTINKHYKALNQFDTVMVSIDACSSTVYNTVRPGYDFDALIASLVFLQPHKASQASFIINETNHAEAIDFIEFAFRCGFDLVYFEVANEPWHRSVIDKESVISALLHFVAAHSIGDRVCVQQASSASCAYIKTILKIDVNGNLKVCPFVGRIDDNICSQSGFQISRRQDDILLDSLNGCFGECMLCNHVRR
jgi:molybdenum cofactor biosynthesis enzyme MoaA